ncbi:hypothetical protein [Micromonospora nigra]|uniref:hypothetical protein n=1 Tax=Micromonospora nigra TaxID=145857 RepID=UPI000B80D4E6|nr:hypothetical protein [Micromonospora nigra]
MFSLRTGPLPRSDDGLWSRRLLAASVAGAVTVATTLALLRVPRFEVESFACVLWLFVILTAMLRRWRPHQDSRLVWRERVVGVDGVEPGLVARRSLAGWIDQVVRAAWVVAVALIVTTLLPTDPPWARTLRLVFLGAAAAVAVGVASYRQARFTGLLALTASGIRHGGRRYDWSNIDRVSLHREDGRLNGVRLRPRVWRSLAPAPVVGGRDVAVPEVRLAAAIEAYRERPQALRVGPVRACTP